MGTARIPARVNLVCGFIFSQGRLFEEARSAMEDIYGGVDYESGTIDFSHTSYYEEEIGCALKRKFVSFKQLADPEGILEVKLRTNELEGRFALGGKRRINIDPGYLDLSKLVLFSTKDYSHRMYLGRGVFGEVTLYFKEGKFHPWPWTYPDYRTAEYAEVFDSIRKIYKNKV